ncbi:hypothetical protein IZY60_01965 [Lutibacter sp. B2]|nr:hypothetical protein [Lutibacter sp. B2]
MENSTKVVDILIQKKFKEVLDARKEGRLYDFKNELRKELEASLKDLNNPTEKTAAEKILHEITIQSTKNNWVN